MPSEVEFTGRAYRLRLSESDLGAITDGLHELVDTFGEESELAMAIGDLRRKAEREYGKAASFKLVAIAREEE